MNRTMVAQELVKIAKVLAASDGVSKGDLMNALRTFPPVLSALDELVEQHEGHWAYGAAPDDVLQDMMHTSAEIRSEASKLAKMLKKKMAEWEKAAEDRS